MIKRLLLLAACCTLWFMFGAAPASADGGPHRAGGPVADGCAGCHRAHTAKAGKLLKEAQPALCFTCHGTSATGGKTDVVSGLGYTASLPRSGPGALRGGGFTSALIGSNAPTGQVTDSFNATGIVPVKAAGVTTTSTHSVDGTAGTAWGNGVLGSATAGKNVSLSCGSCHDPHGNGNYRILKPLPRDSGATVGIAIADYTPPAPVPPATVSAAPKVYTTANYWKVDDDQAPGFIANVSAWCTTCHTRYLATTGTSVDSGDPVFTFRHKSDSKSQGGASCIQCHVAHGSNALMNPALSHAKSALATDPGSIVVTGSSKLLRIDNRGTCQMCHNK